MVRWYSGLCGHWTVIGMISPAGAAAARVRWFQLQRAVLHMHGDLSAKL